MAIAHAPEADRVKANTWREVNERLDTEAAARLEAATGQGADLSRAIENLDREWDFERVLETEVSTMGLLGLALALRYHPGFMFIPGFAAAMMLLHGVQGWYPLLPIFRRMGIRSQNEIDRERYALKALRGDFDAVRPNDTARQRAAAAWRAVCA